jgi:outer membrane receptor protein involved in Fe transport
VAFVRHDDPSSFATTVHLFNNTVRRKLRNFSALRLTAKQPGGVLPSQTHPAEHAVPVIAFSLRRAAAAFSGPRLTVRFGWLAFGTALATLGVSVFNPGARGQDAADASTTPGGTPPAPKTTETIIVTATRRGENINKVPYSISALSGAELKRNGVTDLMGIRNSVPGLQSADYGARGANLNNNFIIRGINTEDTGVGQSEFPDLAGSTVSSYIDDTPLFVNLKLTDIQRVEILRGPQGTLFGADSEGGTVRTIHNKPDPAGYDYEIDGTMSGTDHASQPNDSVNAMLNLPLTPRFALRLNAGYDREAGFIDADNAVLFNQPGNIAYTAQPLLADPANPLTSPARTGTDHGINTDRIWFVRADALWKPDEDSTAELSYQHQDDHSNGFPFEYPGSDYVIKRRLPINPSETRTDIEALTLTHDFGFGTVTSSSSYYTVDVADMYDNSGIDVEEPYYYGNYPRITTPNYDYNSDKAFAQEVRLVSPRGRHLDYVVGVFYQNRWNRAYSIETVPGFAKWANLPGSGPAGYATWADYVTEYYLGTRPGTLDPADLSYDFDRVVHFTDLAGFGEATLHLTSWWRLITGVRVFQENFRQTTLQHIYYAGESFGAGASGASAGSGSQRNQSQIFKASTSVDISRNSLAYFVFSQGYRAGGANAYPIGSCVFCDPASYISFRPDRLDNFEVGVKGVIDRFRYSVAAYDMEWSNIQLEVSSQAGTPIIVNGNGARSTGMELETHYLATDTLQLSGGYAYTNAVLTQSFNVGDGFTAANGDLLPGVSRHQFNVSVDYTTNVFAEHAVDLHLDGSYRSGFGNQIQAQLPNYAHLSGFSMFNAYVQTALTPKAELQLFVHNLFDARGVSSESALAPGGPSPADYVTAHGFEPAEFVSRPLTVGLRLVIHH